MNIIKSSLICIIAFFLISCTSQKEKSEKSLADIQKSILKGWNTWNTYSCLSHVYLPDGLAINFYLQDKKSGEWLKNAFVWAGVKEKEVIWPGPHAIDGS